MTSEKNLTGILDGDAIYFTMRKLTNKKWVVETLQLKGDKLERNQISEPSSRQDAMMRFKVAVVRYWAEMNK